MYCALKRKVEANKVLRTVVIGVLLGTTWQTADCGGAVLPGDRGRPWDGVLPAPGAVPAPPATSVQPPQSLHLAPALPIEIALKAARPVPKA
jgi:hypothetical protein